jgi:uncharacterized protein YjiS (DUF1127 family)
MFSRNQHSKDRAAARTPLPEILHWVRAAYRLGRERYRQRRELMEMDDRQLGDIGITREQAMEEARKPIWKDVLQMRVPPPSTMIMASVLKRSRMR